MTNRPQANPSSHHPQYSDHRSHFRPPSPNPPPYPGRHHNRRDHFPNTGYGGGASARPRSPSHRDRHWRDPPPHPPPPPPPPRSYRNDPYPHPTRNPIHHSPRPRNAYRGGDPFTSHNRLPRRERPNRTPDTLTTPQNVTAPLPRNSRHNSPQRPTPLTPTSGPLKPIYATISPVKPLNGPRRLKAPTSPFHAPKSPSLSPPSSSSDPSHHTATLDQPNSSNQHPQVDRRDNRILSCEVANRDSSKHQTSSQTYAIAHPDPRSSEPLPDIPRRNQQPQPNGSFPARNHSSNQTDARAPLRSHEQVQTIFKKVVPPVPSRVPSRLPSRVPKVPDEKMFKAYTPHESDKADANGTQLKEEPDRKEHQPQKLKLPLLRSVPVHSRSCTPEDTPQRRAAVAAMERASQGEDSDTNVNNDCSGLNGSASAKCLTLDDPYHSKTQSTINPSENRVVETRNNLTSSMAKMNIVDRKRNRSTSEPVQSQELGSNEDDRLERPDQQRQNRFTRAGNKGTQLVKRRATNYEGSRETRAKRPRTSLPPETVNVDDTMVARRTKRDQKFEHKNKKWETIGFEEDRVCALFLSQLQNQPMLLRISFLGMADGDLRTTLGIWKGGMDLPEPQERRLEINNNRIRRITDDICTRIATLRVVSLNLSCNLLTAIGGKIGVCSRLRFLDVSRNQLSFLPQELCDLTSLEVLNLSRNQISKVPSGLCRLKRLEVLSLAWNKLEVLPEDITAEGAVLTDLDLSYNEKFHFFPRCTEHWTKLEVLHMTNTTINGSLTRRERRLRAAVLVKELAGRRQDMFNNRRVGLRSQSS